MPRERQIVALLGRKGAGKTTITRTMLELARAEGARPRVCDTSYSLVGGEWPGYDDFDEWLQGILDVNKAAIKAKQPTPCTMIVFDDGDKYLPRRGGTGTAFNELICGNRGYDLDVIISCRRLASLAPNIQTSLDWVYQFAAAASDEANHERVERMMKRLGGSLAIPRESYRFVRFSPETGEAFPGGTRADGSYYYD